MYNKAKPKQCFSMFRPPSYVAFLPQFHSLNTRDKINMTNPSKDTPKQPISTSPPNPPHCLLMLFEEQLSMYLKFKPQMFSSSPGQTTEKCLHIETLVQRQFCAISIWQDQFYGVVFSLFFFQFHILVRPPDLLHSPSFKYKSTKCPP